MHELSIARDICRIAAEEARGKPLRVMKITVGGLAGVSADALDFCVTEVAADMGLGRPAVEIKALDPDFLCSCGAKYSVANAIEGCPSCGAYARKALSGLDVILTEIEVEDGN
jgi:hydrogenase nickel incorporation protein HypA/HybF